MKVHLSQITPSIFSSLGLTTADDSLSIGPSPSGRELLFLIDGFGADIIEKYRDAMPTIARLTNFATIQTSFPSTTATSLATLTTGTLPGVHGMLGYTVQVPRSGGRILNALKWDERVDPNNWQPVPTLFERAVAENINVTNVAAKRYENSGFTRAVFRGAQYKGANVAADLIAETKAALHKTQILLEQGEKVFLWPEKFGKRFKDFNDIAMHCKLDEIKEEFIQKNTCEGLAGILKLAEIKQYNN